MRRSGRGNDADLYVQGRIGKASPESTPRAPSPRSMEFEARAEKDGSDERS
jgi:hypothetical protein